MCLKLLIDLAFLFTLISSLNTSIQIKAKSNWKVRKVNCNVNEAMSSCIKILRAIRFNNDWIRVTWQPQREFNWNEKLRQLVVRTYNSIRERQALFLHLLKHNTKPIANVVAQNWQQQQYKHTMQRHVNEKYHAAVMCLRECDWMNEWMNEWMKASLCMHVCWNLLFSLTLSTPCLKRSCNYKFSVFFS